MVRVFYHYIQQVAPIWTSILVPMRIGVNVYFDVYLDVYKELNHIVHRTDSIFGYRLINVVLFSYGSYPVEALPENCTIRCNEILRNICFRFLSHDPRRVRRHVTIVPCITTVS